MDYLILREIGMIARCFQTINDIEFRELSLEKGQYLFLVRICENPGINQERLSNMLKVDKTTTAKAVKKLISKGYILKEQSKEDKRSFKLYPDKKAMEIYQFLRTEEDYSTETALKGFCNEEKEIVHKLLKKMRENIEKDWQAVKNGKDRGYLD
ncbi:MarR family winged helix-turn-helix transcriptional regulator [Clostridium ganghwense]|uniref:MarR family transcriptional regulator n=1 Tax=Clostridium ganghwense TaxID=312089 RepID=A0ABT4CRY9_9CLOT|nr:MarR family transcriptional regulator [Clostridium ganghwense]MCY6371688.1 MarR family transcriptional regulator [Clostridium ganghwense]